MSNKLIKISSSLIVLGLGALVWQHWRQANTLDSMANFSLSAASPPAAVLEKASSQSASDLDQVSPPIPPPRAALASPPPNQGSDKDNAMIQAIFGKFATGDFTGALKLADQAAAGPGYSEIFHTWLQTQMPALLTSAGWARLRLGDCEEATLYLRRSEALARSNETSKGLAICYFKQKNLSAAREQFAYYLEKNPNDSDMQIAYADILESDGLFEEAFKVLERTKATTPEIKDLLKQRLTSMQARVRESSYQVVETSRNFRITYRAGDHEELASFVLSSLEETLDEYLENYGFKAPHSLIEITLYPADNFRNLTAGGPEWAEGLFDGRLRIPVRPQILATKQYDSLRNVLRHELVHALLAITSDSRQIAPWFEEGMAQRLSCAGNGCQPFSFPPTPGHFLSPQSFATPYISFSAILAGQAYSQSLYLIYVIEREKGEDALRRLISHITVSSNVSSDGLLRPLGINFQELHQLASELWKKSTALGPQRRY